MKRVLLLINPKARSGTLEREKLEDALRKSQHQLIELTSEEKTLDFNELIRKYQHQVDVVVVGGGDGTVNHVLPALVETQLPLIVFPLGTANLLARSFDLKSDTNEVVQLIKDGKEVWLDLGQVNGHYFINVAGIGVSTKVNANLPKDLKKKTGPFSFWIWGLKKIKELRPFSAFISVNGQRAKKTKTWQLTVCNGRHYGNWMTIKSDATYQDQKLHCLSTEVNKIWKGLFLIRSYLKGEYREKQKVTCFEGREIRIETHKPHPIDVDGDVKTATPAIFKVVPQAIRIRLLDSQKPALTL